jgi:hypothetical protein
MPIINNNPITVQATPQKIYDSLWIKRISIFTPSPNKRSMAEITYCPMSSQDGSIIESDNKRLIVEDILQKAETNPKLNAAMTSLIEAVDFLINQEANPSQNQS